ncbi:hypothetical protein ACIBJI_34575 [Nocardia sp. NPDC050408]|uniref:hypothetical protein n=1 Tax=Nocardia sp. NPDC050408 TaxID=3364319 RepID=UPI0037B74C3D
MITPVVPHSEAWLWPLIIEGSMAQSTVALLALAHSTHGDEHPYATGHVVDDSPAQHTDRAITENTAQAPQAAPNAIPGVHTPSHTSVDARQDLSDLAARLCPVAAAGFGEPYSSEVIRSWPWTTPDRWDLTGAVICQIGVAIIMYAPRPA